MKIHFIGCMGASMSVLMDLASALGHSVSGSDREKDGHNPQNVVGADLVVYTNAVKPDNCELISARELGIKTVERAGFLADLSRLYGKCVAVAGCHGKSTTTAMIGDALLPLSPTVHVGAPGASKISGNNIFVTEACEYNKSFLFLSPDVGVVLNVAYDHPDFYKTEKELEDAYLDFIRNSKIPLVNGDDPFLSKIDCIKFGLGENNYFRAENITADKGMREFDFTAGGKLLTHVALSVPGKHNVYNALASLAVAHILGVPAETAAIGIKSFRGIARRFEFLCSINGKDVYTDYAHHPDEIAATISAAHELYDTVTVVFQPHTYSRTAALYKEEAKALAKAETVILAPIYAAREKPVEGISSELIVSELISAGKPAVLTNSLEECAALCRTTTDKAVIFMGAGDITQAAQFFIDKKLKFA